MNVDIALPAYMGQNLYNSIETSQNIRNIEDN